MTPIESYIQTAPAAVQLQLTDLRATILAVLPDAEEQMKYQMPTFYWHENVIHFAWYKHHIGLYPTPSGVTAFRSELTSYKTSKGAIQLPLDQSLPLDLVRRITEFRKQEVIKKFHLEES